jgi:hypothetical protein
MTTLSPELANLALQIIGQASVPGQAARAVVALQDALSAVAQGHHVVTAANVAPEAPRVRQSFDQEPAD